RYRASSRRRASTRSIPFASLVRGGPRHSGKATSCGFSRSSLTMTPPTAKSRARVEAWWRSVLGFRAFGTGEREVRNPLAFCEGLSGMPASEKPTLREAHDARSGNYEMVEHLHVDQGKRRLERPGENLVGMARLRDARGVIMREDDGRGVRSQRGLHDFPGVNARLRECRGTAPRWRSRGAARRAAGIRKPREAGPPPSA